MKKKKSGLLDSRLKKKLLPIGAGILSLVLILVIVQAISATAFHPNTEGLLVFLDAGHGGKDGGATATFDGVERLEKDDNLRLTMAVQRCLEAKGVRVEVSRFDDTFVELEDIAKKANKSGAQLFVSLHRNSAVTGNGVEIWVEKTAPKEDTKLAKAILDQINKVGISQNRGVRYGLASDSNQDYYVNKHTDMPSCLIEMGFVTSKDDNALLDEKLEQYAQAIANGIIKAANGMRIEV